MVDTCDIKIVIDMLGYVTSMANDFGMFYERKGKNQMVQSALLKKLPQNLHNLTYLNH